MTRISTGASPYMLSEFHRRLWYDEQKRKMMTDIPTYHRGQRNFGTGYEMMDRIEALEGENARLRQALVDQTMSCTCHETYSSRNMQDPECRAGEYGDDCREAVGLPPMCQHNIRLAALRNGEGRDDE